MPGFALPRAALLALFARMLVLWGLVHALYLALMVLMASAAGVDSTVIKPNPFWIIGLSVALAFADVRRRGERALWGNVGLSRGHLALLAALVAAGGELLVWLALR